MVNHSYFFKLYLNYNQTIVAFNREIKRSALMMEPFKLSSPEYEVHVPFVAIQQQKPISSTLVLVTPFDLLSSFFFLLQMIYFVERTCSIKADYFILYGKLRIAGFECLPIISICQYRILTIHDKFY